MNRAKRGEILYEDMELAARNGDYVRENPDAEHVDTEEKYLAVVIQKAQARLKQIEEDKKNAK